MFLNRCQEGHFLEEDTGEDTKMKITRRQLRQIIAENLLLEAPNPLTAEVVFQQLLRGDAAFLGQRLSGSTTTFIKSCASRGIVGSTGTVYRGGDAVAYLVHRILPRVYASNLGSASSATAVKNSLNVIKMFANQYDILTPLANYRVVEGPNYVGKLLNTKMGRQILNTMPKAAQTAESAVQTVEKAGALLTKSAAQVTNAITRTASAPGSVRTAQQAARLVMKAPEAANAVRQIGAGVIKSGQPLARVPQGAQLVNSAASGVASSTVPEVAANASKLSKFLKFLGPLSLAMFVLDVYYTPVALLKDGELVVPGTGGLIKWKVGIGIKDMDTPWGQLAYRKRAGMPPAKPSDFNNEYKNIIATIVWNQRREGEEGAYAKKWTQKAIADNLIDIAAWKTYLDPWREAEAKIKEGEAILAEDAEGEESGGSEDISPIGDIDEDALASLGEDTGETLSDSETGDQARERQDSGTRSGWDRYIENSSDKVNAKKIKDNWQEFSNINGVDASSDYAGFVKWYKSTRQDGDLMKIINKKAGDNFNPKEAFKLMQKIGEASGINESLSRGALIRKRYWGRY